MGRTVRNDPIESICASSISDSYRQKTQPEQYRPLQSLLVDLTSWTEGNPIPAIDAKQEVN